MYTLDTKCFFWFCASNATVYGPNFRCCKRCACFPFMMWIPTHCRAQNLERFMRTDKTKMHWSLTLKSDPFGDKVFNDGVQHQSRMAIRSCQSSKHVNVQCIGPEPAWAISFFMEGRSTSVASRVGHTERKCKRDQYKDIFHKEECQCFAVASLCNVGSPCRGTETCT